MFGKKDRKPYEEVEEYRDLMEVPDHFEEGFTVKTILGVLFVALIMVPGNMYLGLMIGGGLGAAAQWVTIILFAEIAKRSFTTLKRQEVYLLYYVSISLVAAGTGTFQGLMWNQYLVQSPAAKQFGIAKLIPAWVAPPAGSEALIHRTFFHADWVPAIILLIVGMLISRVSWFTMGYMLFRLTSDVEKLPFPFAPIQAQGAMALAETTTGEESWRWRIFSTGAMIGLVFGAIYVGVPAITGAFLAEPIQIIPIPFVDFTQVTGNFLPATPLGFTAHLGPIFAGLVLPFWGVLGGFLGVMVYTIANPFLWKWGYLTHWRPGMGTIETFFVNNVDFWMSFGIGITLSIAMIGIYQVFTGVRKRKQEALARGEPSTGPPPGRGDFPIWICVALFVSATCAILVVGKVLLPGFSQYLWFFLFFGFIFTPIQSFINARLWAMVGQTVSIPYVREATILLSGYRGIDIWFVPLPLANYGVQAAKFREVELTGTKFTSILKAEIFMVPIVLATSFMYWSYIWKLAPIPSSSYPYAQLMWRLQAYQQCLWLTGTYRSEMEMDEGEGAVTWIPANLTDRTWWYWRARLVDMDRLADRLIASGQLEAGERTDFVQGELESKWVDWVKSFDDVAGPWTDVRTLFTDFEVARLVEAFIAGGVLSQEDRARFVQGALREEVLEKAGGHVPLRAMLREFEGRARLPERITQEFEGMREKEGRPLPDLTLAVIGPEDNLVVTTAVPDLLLRREEGGAEGHKVQYYFEMDSDLTFSSPWMQASTDEPWLFRAIQPQIIGAGLVIGLGSFIVLSMFGLPILLIFGYVRSLTTIPHWIITEIIGALLARFYFWKKYGKKQWRLYAAVLSVGFACGMALMGMASIAIALIQKSVSVLIF